MPVNNTTDFQKTAIPFSSNCIRLSIGQWIIVTVICLAASYLTPVLWERLEDFSPGPDYRIPYELSNDYWLYERYCQWACSRNETLIIGDSVIWGHYVSRDNTLSHYLNKMTGVKQFANLGLDGIHPAAMEGLLRYYGKNISNKNVILHLNPLWMSTPKLDLKTEKEYHFNHPKLVAQFTPRIPCYRASFPTRLSVVIRRFFTLPNWISHINITYYKSNNIPAWTIENPYKNPFEVVTFKLPDMDNYEHSEGPAVRRPQADNQHKKDTDTPLGVFGTDGYQWVAAEKSLQWSSFRRTIQLLKERGNCVFVLVGPFNEHTLGGKSLEACQKLKNEIEQWLQQNRIAYYMPPVLPAKIYQDASHPLSEGYAMIAKQLFENQSFNSTILHATESNLPN